MPALLRPSLLRRWVVPVITAALLTGAFADVRAEAPAGADLFGDHALPAARARTAGGSAVDASICQRRPVRVRRELLAAPAAVAVPLRFNLFAGATFTAIPERDERAANGDRVIAGSLAGVPGSQFLLVVHGEEVAADVFVSPWERYQLRREPGEGGSPEVRRLHARGLPTCAAPLGVPGESAPRRAGPQPRAEATDPNAGDPTPAEDRGQFDVLIAYTPAARAEAGGTAAIEAEARLAVEGANQRYLNSNITTRARLVQTLEVPYGETAGDIATDLRHLLGDDAGPLTDVRAARDAAAADLACLFVASPATSPPGGLFVGVAQLAVAPGDDGQPVPRPDRAFSVVMPAHDVATTFAHEVGHGFGCQHDVDNLATFNNTPSPPVFPFSFGWRFTDPYGRVLHDVMAYPPGGVIPYFSNPQVLYNGVPTGSATADNARTMNATAVLVANFRRLPVVAVTAPRPRAFAQPLIPGRLTVHRTGRTDRPLSVSLAVDADPNPSRNPVPAQDYAPLPDRVTIPAGQTSISLDVTPIANGRENSARILTLRALPPGGYRVDPRPGVVVIRDTPQTVSVFATTTPAVGGREPRAGAWTLTRSGPLNEPLTAVCQVTTWPAALAASLEFTGFDAAPAPVDPLQPPPAVLPRTVTFPPGADTVTANVLPRLDLPTAGHRAASLRLADTADAKALVAAAVVDIAPDPGAPDPPPPTLSVVPLQPAGSLLTGETALVWVRPDRPLPGTLVARLVLTGSAIVGRDCSVDDAVAAPAGGLRPVSGPGGYAFPVVDEVFLSPGADGRIVRITPLAGGVDALSKGLTLTLDLSAKGDYAVDATRASFAVTLLGAPVVTATVTGPEARAASDLGPVKGEFTLRREGDPSAPLTVRYAVGGSATPGLQYKALPGLATFPAGQDFVRVKVKPRGNAGGPNAQSTVKLTLRPGDGYTLGDAAEARVKVLGGE